MTWDSYPLPQIDQIMDQVTCELNYGSGNKVKPVGISGNKGRYNVLCYSRDQNFSHS
jgi:hypothetical protein